MFNRRIFFASAAVLLLCSHVSGAFADNGDFKLTSAQMTEGQNLSDAQVLKGFGCEGGNLSPQLSWTGAPDGTKSFVVTAYDPDAPTGSGWWHWVVVNIPVSVSELKAGLTDATLPAGAMQGRTDFGQPGFGGACPPAGDKPHRYVFTVFALKVEKLEVDQNASAAFVGYMTNANAIAKASLTTLYSR